MLTNFHGFVFGYQFNQETYEKLRALFENDIVELDTFDNNIWQINRNTFLLAKEILIHTDSDDGNSFYSIQDLNERMAELKMSINDWTKWAGGLMKNINKTAKKLALPQLYYINITM